MLDCIVVGDAMMDVILRSDREIFRSMKIDGTNYFSNSKVTPGGSGNLCAAISWLGGKSGFIGKVGSDAYGRAYLEDLASIGIIPRVEFDPVIHTGLVVSLVEPTSRRTMLVYRGANDKLTPGEVRSNLKRLGPARFLYISGYSLAANPQRKAIVETTTAKATNSKLVFDPGSPNLVQELPRVFAIMAKRCDVLCANLEEAESLASNGDVPKYLASFSKKRKVGIVKLGERGCLLATGGRVTRIHGVPAESVDTTGAGDAFLGALLYCLSHGHLPIVSANFANWFASRKTEGLGPRYFPQKREAKSFLNDLSKRSASRQPEPVFR